MSKQDLASDDGQIVAGAYELERAMTWLAMRTPEDEAVQMRLRSTAARRAVAQEVCDGLDARAMWAWRHLREEQEFTLAELAAGEVEGGESAREYLEACMGAQFV